MRVSMSCKIWRLLTWERSCKKNTAQSHRRWRVCSKLNWLNCLFKKEKNKTLFCNLNHQIKNLAGLLGLQPRKFLKTTQTKAEKEKTMKVATLLFQSQSPLKRGQSTNFSLKKTKFTNECKSPFKNRQKDSNLISQLNAKYPPFCSARVSLQTRSWRSQRWRFRWAPKRKKSLWARNWSGSRRKWWLLNWS